jgi:glycosyltransferase involved in cell wall biosynthesis
MNMAPILTVVVPTFNRAGTIMRAVDSVLATPRRDISLVVVDDASTDETSALLTVIDDRRLSYLRMETRENANKARNRGAFQSEAPLLAFLDSDDEFLPGRLERLIAFFDDHPDIDCVIDGFVVSHAGRERTHAPPLQVADAAALEELLVAHALPITCSTIALRRPVFCEIGGYDERLLRHQDRDILLRLAKRHKIVLGTGDDVRKHQSADSFSRRAAGYIDGLDALVARHPVFRAPEHAHVLGYLIARAAIRELAAWRFASFYRCFRALHRAKNLPFGLTRSLLLYRRGRGLRKQAERKLAQADGRL